MAKSRSLPKHVLRIERYDELAKFVKAFADGHLRFLMLVGAPGTAKSYHVRLAVGDRAGWIDGNATAFGIYEAAYQNCGEPLVLDDVDALYRDQNGVRLLKQLCQSDDPKRVGWHSDSRALERRGLPRQFLTRSSVAIIANRWHTANEDVSALEDRAHMLHFDPPPLEVHQQAATWFHDQEVFDFVADHLHLMSRHSLRTYIQAAELKQAGLEWKTPILSRFISGKAVLVARLMADPNMSSNEERISAFAALDGGCRATYFSYAKKLRRTNPAPRIKLANTNNPAREQVDDVMSLLRKRFGSLGNG